ncbi:MAG: hypothetical protein CVU68_01735 [Deltaproteobacteria bacterium HGW-Deltaproteobacteria-3]|nr:MAG: hypothetical protein CVU68_01735 [Deltaproteobacteria bacterium HGW-Deltaproteobacteria-3]
MAKEYIIDNASKMGDAIGGRITDMQQSVSVAIATSADIIKGEATRVAGEVADNRDKKRVALAGSENAARAQQDYGILPPNPCDSLSSAAISGEAARSAARTAATEHAGFRMRGRNTSSPASATYTTYSRHREKYCGPADVAQKRCSSTSSMPDADIDPRSLTHGAGLPGNQSYVFSQQQAEAARAYASNVSQAVPRPVLPGNLENTDQGRGYEAMRLAEQAKLGLAASVFTEAMAWRAPAEVDGVSLAQHIKNIWAKMGGVSVPQGVEDAIKSGRASHFLLQQAEVDRRANNPEWYSQMLAASPAAVNREVAFMLARMLEMQHRQELRLERQEMLLAGILSEGVRANGGQIDSQYRAATSVPPSSKK